MRETGFEVRRMDEFATTKAINVQLQKRIRAAHFVLFCASRNNVNVLFEAGYAHARGTYPVVPTPKVEELPLDLRSNYVIAIDSDILTSTFCP